MTGNMTTWKKTFRIRWWGTLVAVVWVAGMLGCEPKAPTEKKRERKPAPVAVAKVERGTIDAFRTFSGSLEASASFTISAKVGGRVAQMLVDIGDAVQQGMVVARIDDEEYAQALKQARADMMVARANLAEAKSLLEISGRTLERSRTLLERGVTSEAELDTVRSDYLARGARVAVLEAQVTRAKATLQQNKIQLGYATVKAVWAGDASERVVAERFVDDGAIVAANSPLYRIVDLSPVIAVFHVPEKEYGSLAPGQTVTMETDAWPGETFAGKILRIAPVFQDNSRQARVEVTLPNGDERLKPGMFVKTGVKVRSVENARIVPADAIVNREDSQGVFVVDAPTRLVKWRPVTVDVRQGDRVAIQGTGVDGLVVTLGQQLIEDGAEVIWDLNAGSAK
jgi:RND family efflux transporter MFP subunit